MLAVWGSSYTNNSCQQDKRIVGCSFFSVKWSIIKGQNTLALTFLSWIFSVDLTCIAQSISFALFFVFFFLAVYLYWKTEAVITKEDLFSSSKLRCTWKSKMSEGGSSIILVVKLQKGWQLGTMYTQWQVNLWPCTYKLQPHTSTCVGICIHVAAFITENGCFWFEHHQDCETT